MGRRSAFVGQCRREGAERVDGRHVPRQAVRHAALHLALPADARDRIDAKHGHRSPPARIFSLQVVVCILRGPQLPTALAANVRGKMQEVLFGLAWRQQEFNVHHDGMWLECLNRNVEQPLRQGVCAVDLVARGLEEEQIGSVEHG